MHPILGFLIEIMWLSVGREGKKLGNLTYGEKKIGPGDLKGIAGIALGGLRIG